MFIGIGMPLTLGARGGGLPAFNPASLFASSEAGAWYEPSDLSTLFQNSDGTTAVGVGDPVGYMADKSGNGNHATQATAAARPTLQQTAGGLYYLDFDGVDDFLALPNIPFSSDTGVNAFMAADTTNLGTGAAIAFSKTGNVAVDTVGPYFGGGVNYAPSVFDQQTLPNNNDRFRAINAPTQANAIFSWQASLTSAGQRTAVTRVNRAEVSETYTIDNLNPNEAFTAINSNAGVQFSDINMYEAIIRCAAPLGATAIFDTETYLAAKSGVEL